MIRPEETAKIDGSVRREMVESTVEGGRPAARRRDCRRDQREPMTMSRACVKAKRVRSRVRPA